MCTSIFVTSKTKQHYLARTMDFVFPLEATPIFIPRGYVWKSLSGEEHTSQYAFIGSGSAAEAKYLLADGINEKGVSIAELYFSGEARYQDELIKDKINLAPHEFITWLLGDIASITDLRHKINDICLQNIPNKMINTTVPLHYIVSDASGESIVLESDNSEGILKIKENSLGVMANSPELEWHLKNARNYLGLDNHAMLSREVDQFDLLPTGLSSGTFGLPGGFTSSERFIRAVYLRHVMLWEGDEAEVVNQIIHLLDNVSVPKGAVKNNQGECDYSQYKAIFNNNELIYYHQPYSTHVISKIDLKQLVDNKEVKVYNVLKINEFSEIE